MFFLVNPYHLCITHNLLWDHTHSNISNQEKITHLINENILSKNE